MAAVEPLNGKMVSLIAVNINGERPNLFSRVGHHSQITAASIKGHRHLAVKDRNMGSTF